MNQNIKPIKLIILIIIAYTSIVFISGVVEIRKFISDISFSFYLLSLFFPLCSHFILSIRWHILMRFLGIRIVFFENIKIYFSGLALIAAPARAGEAIRSVWLLNKFKLPLKIGIGITLSERIGDLLSALLVIIWSFYGNIFYPILALISLLFLFSLNLRRNFLNLRVFNLRKIDIINNIFFKSDLSRKLHSLYLTVKIFRGQFIAFSLY